MMRFFESTKESEIKILRETKSTHPRWERRENVPQSDQPSCSCKQHRCWLCWGRTCLGEKIGDGKKGVRWELCIANQIAGSACRRFGRRQSRILQSDPVRWRKQDILSLSFSPPPQNWTFAVKLQLFPFINA